MKTLISIFLVFDKVLSKHKKKMCLIVLLLPFVFQKTVRLK